MRVVYGRLPYELSSSSSRPRRRCRDGYRSPRSPSPQRRGVPSAMRSSRSRARGIRPRWRGAGVTPGPDFGRAAARGDGQRRGARAGDGPGAGGPQGRALRRHRAVRGARDRRASGRRARARGDVRRGGGRAGAPDRAQHRAPGRRAGPRRRGAAARAHAHLQPLRRRELRDEARTRCSPRPRRRATSTRSRCPSPSAARPS
jgi:hypothetical protein